MGKTPGTLTDVWEIRHLGIPHGVIILDDLLLAVSLERARGRVQPRDKCQRHGRRHAHWGDWVRKFCVRSSTYKTS